MLISSGFPARVVARGRTVAARRGLSSTLVSGAALVLFAATALTSIESGCTRADAAPAVGHPVAPRRLADTGLYSDFERLVVAPENRAYSPQYPLWSDGALKRRWIHLPPGASIDASDPDAWRFPIGTKLWKEMRFERRIETRYMELGPDGVWIYATYLWSADERDAVLAPTRGVLRAHVLDSGAPYDIPGVVDCGACHGGRSTPVLGFGALQLSPDRDPLAPHADPAMPDALDLTRLVETGLVRGLPSELALHPPRIDAVTARERAVIGYLGANCGHCHAGDSKLDTLGLAMDVPLRLPLGRAFPLLDTTFGRPSHWTSRRSAANPRIAPGAPERSVLVERMSSRNPLAQMPPLGSHVVDEEALALVTSWIREDLLGAAARTNDASRTSPDHLTTK